MFISDAWAATAPVMEGGSLGATLVQLALILLIFYFLLIRPQQKRIKQHQDLVESLKVGDRVLTNGGIYGKVVKLSGNDLMVEIAPSVEIVVARAAVSGLAEPDVEKSSAPKTAAKSKRTKK